jgi:hypothetical protein
LIVKIQLKNNKHTLRNLRLISALCEKKPGKVLADYADLIAEIAEIAEGWFNVPLIINMVIMFPDRIDSGDSTQE